MQGEFIYVRIFSCNKTCELKFSHVVGIKMVKGRLFLKGKVIYRHTLDKFMKVKFFTPI